MHERTGADNASLWSQVLQNVVVANVPGIAIKLQPDPIKWMTIEWLRASWPYVTIL